MASDVWFSKLESVIFTIIKARMTAKLRSKYPNIFFTTSSQIDTEPAFPTVYIHETGCLEAGNDLENKTVNAVIETIQVDVTANTSDTDCKTVATEVINQLKALRFNIVGFPVYTIDGNIHRAVIRARRTIGSGDTDIVLI